MCIQAAVSQYEQVEVQILSVSRTAAVCFPPLEEITHLTQEQFDIVCCCQIAANGAAGGLGVR